MTLSIKGTRAPGERRGPFPNDDLDRCDMLMGVPPRPAAHAPARRPPLPAQAPPAAAGNPHSGISPVMACAVSYRLKVEAAPLNVAGGLFAARAVPEGCCTLEEIVRAVLSAWPGVERNELFSPRRARRVVRPRQALYALLREFTRWSLPHIGRAVDRDHTSILHGLHAAEMFRDEDPEFAAAYDAARRACLAHIERRAAAERTHFEAAGEAGGAP